MTAHTNQKSSCLLRPFHIYFFSQTLVTCSYKYIFTSLKVVFMCEYLSYPDWIHALQAGELQFQN